MPGRVDSEVARQVLAALAMPQFDWRTVDGVAAVTGLNEEEVRHALVNLSEVVEFPAGSSTGERLFALRERASARASLAQKAIGAVRNRLF